MLDIRKSERKDRRNSRNESGKDMEELLGRKEQGMVKASVWRQGPWVCMWVWGCDDVRMCVDLEQSYCKESLKSNKECNRTWSSSYRGRQSFWNSLYGRKERERGRGECRLYNIQGHTRDWKHSYFPSCHLPFILVLFNNVCSALSDKPGLSFVFFFILTRKLILNGPDPFRDLRVKFSE